MAKKQTPEEPLEESQGSEMDSSGDEQMHNLLPVSGMFQNWFMDYASYVILDRAVPSIEDGLKPVQRRILHAMKEMDDGRYHKVANIIGQTMQYHPHGDAAIGDALVKLGQKDLLVDPQGNWGNVVTGDSAAAARYIEARLNKFALEILFNSKTTTWQLSYDGRKKEPVTLPAKFPILLEQGAEGIAVGLSTKILPHNFIEILKACIAHLKERSFTLLPDFPTGGMVDVSDYRDGERGGRVRVRARIREHDKSTLIISDVPFGVTTSSLIDSILKANEKGKIKVKRIDDNTAKDVEIVVHLAAGVSPSQTVDGLYAFTECEVSISPNCCVIIDDKPVFTNVKDVLRRTTERTKDLLRQELEIRKAELEEGWHMSSLEKIFIENRIYRKIENCETWEAVISTIDKGLDPWKPSLRREVTRDDIVQLTEIKIKRISKYDSFKADEYIKGLEKELKQVKHDLKHLTEYTIAWYEELLKKYGAGKERITEIKTFDTIQAAQVAVANAKLYMNREDGFIGTGLKKDEFIVECSDLDDIIVFRKDGVMMVTKVADKTFVGKNILHAGILRKDDDRMVYHMIYEDAGDKRTYVKRFQAGGVTRNKEYVLTKSGKPGKVLYFSANPNGESEVVQVRHKPSPRLRKLEFDFNFKELEIKGRAAAGNLLTQHAVSKVTQKSKGASTLQGRKLWFDDTVLRLNADGFGRYLGMFEGEDKILVLYKEGSYELTGFDLTHRFDGKGEIAEIIKFQPKRVLSALHMDGKSGTWFLKRFMIETLTPDKKFSFLSEEEGSKCLWVSAKDKPVIAVKWANTRKADQKVKVEDFASVKGWKALGQKLSEEKVRAVELLSYNEAADEQEPADTPEDSAPAAQLSLIEVKPVAKEPEAKFIKKTPPPKGKDDKPVRQDPKSIKMDVVDKRGKGSKTLFD
jgi:topoisomerase-4 subunit A